MITYLSYVFKSLHLFVETFTHASDRIGMYTLNLHLNPRPAMAAFWLLLGTLQSQAGLAAPPVIDLTGQEIVFGSDAGFEWVEGKSTNEDPFIIEDHLWTRTLQTPNAGPGATPIWYRFKLHNATDFELNPSFVSMDAANPESVNLIVEQGDGTRKISRSGTNIPMNLRPIVSRLIVLPISLKPGETVTAYLGIQSYYTRNLLYQIKMPASLARYEANSMLFFGIFFGLLWYFIFINILAWLKLRLTLSLVYAIFCLSVFLPCFVGVGFLNLLIPGDMTFNSGLLENCLIPLQLSAACMLTREYLRTAEWNTLMYRFFSFFAVAGIFLAAVTAFNQWTAAILKLNGLLVSLCVIAAISTAILGLWRKKDIYAVPYIVGFGSYMVLGCIWMNQIEGRLPSVWWSTHGVFMGQIIQTCVVSYIILDRLREINEAKARSDEAEINAERLSTFVKVLTHDLSNSLTVIAFNAKTLLNSQVDSPNWIGKVQKIIRATDNQRDVITSVRELKAAQDGKVEFKMEQVDMAPLFDNLKDIFEESSQAKKVHIKFPKINPGQFKAFAEHRSLQHSVLANLISNAIKFSSQGQTIEISCTATSDRIIISITDSGIGIPTNMINSIFDPRVKTSRRGTEGEAGTGFGLPIVKAYMDQFKGKITVASLCKDQHPTGHGTIFTLDLMRA